MPRLGNKRDAVARQKVLAAVVSGKTHNWEIAEYCEITSNLTTDILNELVNAGTIKRTKFGFMPWSSDAAIDKEIENAKTRE